jgi:RND family efflux transporter MFP subunit
LARRQKHERFVAVRNDEASVQTCDDLGQLLHEEIDRLPDRYRAPVVLCDLEGRTHEQVARHLGWPVGTVKTRLTRARQRLRDRLTRRGLAPEAEFTVALWPGLGEQISESLIASTTRSAVQFDAYRIILRGSTAIIAQGVLKTMSTTRWWKVASLLLVAGTTAWGVGLMAGRGIQAIELHPQKARETQPGAGGEVAVATAKGGKFEVLVTERGQLETMRRDDILCTVEGRNTIISLLPEGSRVKKGDLVGELDSASLRDQLVNQRGVFDAAERAHQTATLAREVAEITLKEYEEGIFLHEKASVQGGLKLMESALTEADARVQRTKRAREKLTAALARKEPGMDPADILADLNVDDRLAGAEHELLRSKLEFEKAQSRLNLLENYTKGKTIKELKAGVEKALAEELARQQRSNLEKDRMTHLERQIARCKLVAPSDGVVLYANDPHPTNRAPAIDQGASVRERQILASILDIGGPMQVDAKVSEAFIKRVREGQKARVNIDAFQGESFAGLVVAVAPLPDPTPTLNPKKVYTTKIRLVQKSGQLRPGMTATAQILVDDRDDVLTIPVQAVDHSGGKSHVAVRKPNGGFEWREVVLGEVSNSVIEIREGLKAGDQVALDLPELFRRGLNPKPPGDAR